MKKIIFIVLIFLSLVNLTTGGNVPFAYNLKIEPKIMHVKLNYIPIVPDSTVFEYGNSNGGMKDMMNSLVNLHSTVKFKIDTTKRKITFYYKDNNPIEIKYDIIDTHKPQHKVVGEMFRPIITDNYFFSLTSTLFLTPTNIDGKKYHDLTMSVTLDKKPAFPMYFSCAPEMKPGETITLNLWDGLDVLITGATDLHIEKREMAGIKNYIVLRINEKNKYNLKRFMDYFDTFLPAMTNFWGNLNGTYYTLVASKFQDINYHSISGTAFKGGFHVKFSSDTILVNEDIVVTISHEIMHRYIGSGCITLGDNNEWFNEGFTDYTTWYLLAQSGIISNESYKNIVKDTYNKLAANPVRSTPNEDIMKHFWDDHNYEKLPYNRGALFAAYIDKRIVELNKGTKTYQDFMRDLKALAEQKKDLLTVNDFITVASKYIPKAEIKNAILLYIMKGEMIPEGMIIK